MIGMESIKISQKKPNQIMCKGLYHPQSLGRKKGKAKYTSIVLLMKEEE